MLKNTQSDNEAVMQTVGWLKTVQNVKPVCVWVPVTYAQDGVGFILNAFEGVLLGPALPHFEEARAAVGQERELLQHDVFRHRELFAQIHRVTCTHRNNITEDYNTISHYSQYDPESKLLNT